MATCSSTDKNVDAIKLFATSLTSAVRVTERGLEQPFQQVSDHLATQFHALSSTYGTATCCTVPSFQLQRNDGSAERERVSLADSVASSLQQPRKVPRSDLRELPVSMLWNLSRSFISLTDSRLNSTVTALCRCDEDSKMRSKSNTRLLASLLSSSSNPVDPKTLVTTFRVVQALHRLEDVNSCAVSAVLEAVFDFDVFGTLVVANIEAPATIVGQFTTSATSTQPALSHVEIKVDTEQLLSSMMNQVKMLVRAARDVAQVTLKAAVFAHEDYHQCLSMGTPVYHHNATTGSDHCLRLENKRNGSSSRGSISSPNRQVENSPQCESYENKRHQHSGISILSEAASRVALANSNESGLIL